MSDVAKDEELMPPPSSVLTQEYAVQLDNLNSLNSKQTNCIILILNCF